jgi:SAM-dependent methyltransferase
MVPTPLANAFVPPERLDRKQETYPLDVFYCHECSHAQLLDIVDPKILFEHYVYVSGTSQVFVKHFAEYADFLVRRFALAPQSLVVDIGSNDGTLLSSFHAAGMRVLGIDPAKEISAASTARGVETINDFFTPQLAARIVAERGQAQVVTANNVFAHIDDLAAVLEGVRTLLTPSGVYVFEVSYLLDVWEKTLFDVIYHEHLDYHSVKPLRRFLDRHGFELIEVQRVDSHGGSLRAITQIKGGPHTVHPSVAAAVAYEESVGLDRLETLQAFAERVQRLKNELQALLQDIKRQGKRIAGFGAPAKATTLMYHFGIGRDLIDFIIDDSPLKQGLFTPGRHIPVVPSTAIADQRPDYLLILAWNFAPSIIAKNEEFRRRGGKFIVPVPKLEVI